MEYKNSRTYRPTALVMDQEHGDLGLIASDWDKETPAKCQVNWLNGFTGTITKKDIRDGKIALADDSFYQAYLKNKEDEKFYNEVNMYKWLVK
mgnify:CR=1 FL=1|tara:strand:+ start:384 stop:662 length:279 start_codon:yes stop_codon:yes gene_type:complete